MTRWGGDAIGALLLVVASLATTLALTTLARSTAPPSIATRRELLFTDDARACESCHPRQSAEWRRSAMAHAADSPLFLALEMLVEEQIGRSASCPEGAGILRSVAGEPACRDPASGLRLSGAGGEGWCVSCHAPGQNLGAREPGWSRRESENRSLGAELGRPGRDGIGCTVCHQLARPRHAGSGGYQGNPAWFSSTNGERFSFRPAALEARQGIANSGYRLDPLVLLARGEPGERLVPGGAHRALDDDDRAYLRSSELCGTCHDVRLFGTDVLGRARGEHFKRLRNVYSEWVAYGRERRARGEPVPSCQSCHLSTFPGVCVAEAGTGGAASPTTLCPPGTSFSAREPGALSLGLVANDSAGETPTHPHYFTGVEVPLAPAFDLGLVGERSLDSAGLPLGLRARQTLMLRASVSLTLGALRRVGARGLEVPLTVENVGAGHRVPAGFSQERELWVHLSVTNAAGRFLYEVGRVDRPDVDLADKVFLDVGTDDRRTDAEGRPLGLFGADIADGPDVPRWEPPPDRGGTRFRGRGLMSFQNGFLRCVRCRGRLVGGRCEPLPEQERARADRFEDGKYDPDTGACESNLEGRAALFETYFPVGALDATRGLTKAPDAIIDTRSLPPATPVTYVYELSAPPGPIHVEARLMFRAFPPYLLRAFAEYERGMQARGRRPSGPLIGLEALERLELVELARVEGALR